MLSTIISLLILSAARGQDAGLTMRMKIDATDLPRKLISAELQIPLTPEMIQDGKVALWYPKWVPGAHGPGGPIQNVAGLEFELDGTRLNWRRTPGEFYRVEVEALIGGAQLTARVRYITNQPATNSMGTDSYGSSLVGFVSPSTVLLYPEGFDINTVQIESSIMLPDDWQASTALGNGEATDQGNSLKYPATSLRKFVDSPIMCGKYRKIYDLAEGDSIPPHRMHIFSEAESVLTIHPEMHKLWSGMVTQAARIFGDHPFDQFEILLATTDLLSKNGLEHSRCTFNILGQRSMQDPKKLKGWDRLLIPHEYIHSWCGKYRRPAGMVNSDFHSPKGMDLLWVYEGLTQYLGELTEVRCGLMSPDEFRHRLEIEVRRAMHQQGRDWRTLSDTGACSPILRAGSSNWPRLRRSQDYYMEGMLFWIEADAIIRKRTHNEKSLDDFCHHFFAHADGDPHPKPYTRDDVIKSLGSVVDFDWRGLIQRRVDTVVDRFDPSFVDLLGYSVQYSNTASNIPANTFRASTGTDLLDSIGAVISSDGTVSDLLLGSPAHAAGLGPGMKIMGVGEHKYSKNRMLDAIAKSGTTGEIKLMLVSGDSFEHRTIKYDGGPRYMTLVRQSGQDDILAEIVKPR